MCDQSEQQNIKKILQKSTTTSEYWDQKLHFTLHAYQTSTCNTMGQLLIITISYGGSLTNKTKNPLFTSFKENWTWRDRLDLVPLCLTEFQEEKKMITLPREQCYQKQIAIAYVKKFKPKRFQGDMTLRKFNSMRTLWDSNPTTRVLILWPKCCLEEPKKHSKWTKIFTWDY